MNPTQDLLPDLVTRQVTPARVLRTAARYIAVYGWWQGGMFAENGKNGNSHPPACAAGAIRFAIVGSALPFDEATLTGDGDLSYLYDLFVNTVDALCGYLLNTGAVALTDELTEPYEVVAEWNDDEARNACQVLAALKEAARDWDRHHTSGGAR